MKENREYDSDSSSGSIKPRTYISTLFSVSSSEAFPSRGEITFFPNLFNSSEYTRVTLWLLFNSLNTSLTTDKAWNIKRNKRWGEIKMKYKRILSN